MLPDAETCHHVFAYGSLMWQPGFEFLDARPAKLDGYHRRLNVQSFHYRGTLEQPGLVLGLEKGGVCEGVLYEIEPANWNSTHVYLRKRELVTDIYHEVVLPVKRFASTEYINAMTYVVDPAHHQYAPHKNLKETISIVKQGFGVSGSCEDYVLNTIRHLRDLGIKDQEIELLAPYLKHSSSVTQR